jgi:hypothetical protein
MPSTYTSNNGIELISTGEQSGTWGETTNTNFDLIDTALDGQVTKTLPATGTSGSPNTLIIEDGTTSDGRNRLVIFNDGSDLGGTAYVQLTPDNAEKIMFVRNSLSGNRSIIFFQGTYNASNDFELPNGTDAIIKFDGAGTGAVVEAVFKKLYLQDLTATTADINGGTIDGTVIGGASAAAGTFTTVTTSGDVTIADKIVHSGDTNTAIRFPAADTVTVETAGAERMRIDSSGNVGIGTSSPAARLHVAGGSARFVSGGSGGIFGDDNTSYFLVQGSPTANAAAIYFNGQARSGFESQLHYGASTHVFYNESLSAERMRITSGGTLQIAGGGNDNVGEINMGNTAQNANRFQVRHQSSAWYLKTVDSEPLVFGTANTERMRIDASGNLLVGTTSGTGRIVVRAAGADSADSTVMRLAQENYNTGGASLIKIGTEGNGWSKGAIGFVRTGDFDTGALIFAVNGSSNSDDVTSANERMRIDSSGNVGIGASPPAGYKLQVTDVTPTIRISGTAETAGLSQHITFGTPTYNRATIQSTNVGTQGADLKFLTAPSGGSTAERMCIDSSGNVGIGTSSPGHRLNVSAGQATVKIGSSTTSAGNEPAILMEHAGNNAFQIKGGADLIFSSDAGANERMRITTAGNVGIGTSSPAQKLHVSTAGNNYIVSHNTAGSTSALLLGAESGSTSIYSWTTPTGSTGVPLKFFTGASEAMRIDASGNLGLGATPSSWGSSVKVAQVSNASIAGQSNQALFSNNAFFDGAGWKYISSAVASQYYLDVNAQHQWLTAPSGTAGNAITFTQAMTLDSSGNLLVGRTSSGAAGYKLQVNGSGGIVSTANAAIEFGIRTPDATFNDSYLNFGTPTYNRASIHCTGAAVNTGNLVFTTVNAGSAAERMRITSAGNVAVGTTTFDTSNTTGITQQLYAYGAYITIGKTSGAGNGEGYINFNRNGSTIGNITQASTSSVNYNTTSDYRLKENVVDLKGATARLVQLQPKRFEWISDADGAVWDGFIAHEVQSVVPEAVTGTKDEVDADGKPVYQGIDQSKLVPLLTAALQEALTKIEALEARITALEA